MNFPYIHFYIHLHTLYICTLKSIPNNRSKIENLRYSLKICNLMMMQDKDLCINGRNQSYIELAQGAIFMEQNVRFGLILG